jgi:tetratricopeptide (TPR) repeat protein/transcriptional regulator with XRE-family HTH domain
MAAKRQRLAQRRKAVGLSQEALAGVLGIERSTVVRWESGETEPMPWIRPKLAEALRVSVDQLGELLGPAAARQPGAEPAIEPELRLTPVPERVPWQEVTIEPPLLAAGRAEALPVCQLPSAVADFTGREPQIAQLTGMLSRDRDDRVGVPIAVIAGLPGAGKTALALHVAHLIRAAFPDGQLWVPLEGASGHPRDPGEVLGELIRALGVPGSAIPQSTAQRAALYRSRLADRRVLVVADDAASAAQVQPLLPGTGQCAVLVTSRSELAGPAGSRLLLLDPLTQAEAVQLLAKIVGEQRVAAEPGAAGELAAACGQLPLAVRIAGARLAARTSWQLSALARKITDARRRLDELQAGDLSVRASLTQSYQALGEPARTAFRRLALLDTPEFAEWQVAVLLGVEDAAEAAEVVNQLADSSLLTAAGFDSAGQPRYRPHDLLRDYAAERLADEPRAQHDAARARVTGGWLQLAALADARLPREPYFPPPVPEPPAAVVAEPAARSITADPVAWFTTERLSLLTVVERCCSDGRHHAAARLASSLASFQHLQGRLDDAERAWRVIAAAAQHAGDPAAAARARLRLAVAACGQGRHAEARPIVDQCVKAFGELGDQRALATAWYWHAVCEWNLGAYADARQSAQRALELAQDTGDRQTEALALRLLALALANMDMELPDHRQDAIASAERALAVAGELGEPALEQEILHSVATVYSATGRHEDALRLCQQGRGMARDLGLQVAAADYLGLSGDAYYGLGRYRESAESLRSALPIFRDHFMRRHHALCLLKMGYAYQAMGDYQTAIGHLQESLDIFGQLQLGYHAARAREALAICQDSQRHAPADRRRPGQMTGMAVPDHRR